MKTIASIALALCLTAASAFGQLNLLTQTTLSVAVLSTDGIINVTSATGIVAPSVGSATPAGSELYVVAPGAMRGEVMMVRSISGTVITVARGLAGARSGFPNGSMVLIGYPNWFRAYNPQGSCVTASTYVAPHVNTLTGEEWLCSPITLSWVPSFQNPQDPLPTVLVASVAGATAINSPLEHINGTNAITSFTMGVGWNDGPFCVIPDAAFTTTATNNIGKASTAVANRILCWTWDSTNSVFVPTY